MVKLCTCLALLSASFLCVCTALSISRTEKHLSNTLMALDTEIDEMHRLTLEAGLTAMEARKASAEERGYLKTWNTEITAMLQAAQQSISSLNGVSSAAVSTLAATQTTVTSLQAPISTADKALAAATASINALQDPISEANARLQELKPSIQGTNQLIEHTDATMQHVEGTTADVQQAVHHYLHPTWPERILGWVKTGVVTVGQAIF